MDEFMRANQILKAAFGAIGRIQAKDDVEQQFLAEAQKAVNQAYMRLLQVEEARANPNARLVITEDI